MNVEVIKQEITIEHLPVIIDLIISPDTESAKSILIGDGYDVEEVEEKKLFIIRGNYSQAFVFIHDGNKEIKASRIFHETLHIFNNLSKELGDTEIVLSELNCYLIEYISELIIEKIKELEIKIIV